MGRFTVNSQVKPVTIMKCESRKLMNVQGLEPLPDGTLPDGAQEAMRDAVRRILETKVFQRAPRLSSLLRYICAQGLEGGNPAKLTEHEIGVAVFGRKPGYNPMEDNIVRSTARLLRQRLADYYEGEGKSEPWRIEIPKGRYVPEFAPALGAQAPPPPKPLDSRRKWISLAAAGACAAAAIAGISQSAGSPPDRLSQMWRMLLDPAKRTIIVVADTALVLAQDYLGRDFELGEYFSGAWKQSVTARAQGQWYIDSMVNRRYTGLVDADFAFQVARRPEVKGVDVVVRFARDLSIQDARGANLLVVGAAHANPWIAVMERQANFRIHHNQQTHDFHAINRRPREAEPAQWESKAPELIFSLISFLRKPDGDGHALLLQGASIAGTECAIDHVCRSEKFENLMKKVTAGAAQVSHFEALLQTSSLGGNSAAGELLSSRVYRD